MLTRLYLKNYALFAETDVHFPGGFNILTGETGAGKSLLVGALGLIMGKRVDNNVIFHGQDKCVIEAEFSHLSASVTQQLENIEDIDLEGDTLNIRREIRSNGKSRAFINDTPVSLQILRDVSGLLVDMHGQHENQVLLSHEQQIALLDTFADNQTRAAEFAVRMKSFHKLDKEIRELKAQEKEAKEQLAYYQFQVKELAEADLKTGEEEEMEQEQQLLQNAEEIRESLGTTVDQIYQQDDSIYNKLGELLSGLQKISGVNNSIQQQTERLIEAQEILKESSFQMQNLLDSIESDPERLTYVEDRLGVYHRLKLKYAAQDSEELLSKYAELQDKLGTFESIETRIDELSTERESLASELIDLGLSLEAERQKAKPVLEDCVNQLLTEVGFAKARFEVSIARNEHSDGLFTIDGQSVQPNTQGINKVAYMIQTNPGVPPGMLSQIASGGEVSRVMLALKSALAQKAEFPVLIFDEIDTGISGEIAQKVGTVMQKLGDQFQILSITHLPQIAAKGRHHFKIYKQITDNTTSSSIRELNHEDRIQEVAMMLSGADPTDSALQNAKELIASS